MAADSDRKLRLALYGAAGCGGCDVAALEIHEHVLELLSAAELVFWPTAVDATHADLEAIPDGSIDLCLFNGGLRTDENVAMARLLRRKASVLVAFGICATHGGIPGLANAGSRAELIERVYRGSPSTDANGRPCPRTAIGPDVELELPELLFRHRALHRAVPVDYFIPGCPPDGAQVWAVLQAAVAGTLPPRGAILGAGSRSVCDECSLPKKQRAITTLRRRHEATPEPEWCLLEQGFVCLGPATRSGCQARCTAAAMPCRGCYGPAGDTVDQGAAMIGALGSLLAAGSESELQKTVETLVDPVGTFYRFTLAESPLGRRVTPGAASPPAAGAAGSE